MTIITFKTGRTYDVGNEIRTFHGVVIDLTKALEFEQSGIISKEGELSRLILQVMNRPAYQVGLDEDDLPVMSPEITDGIDITSLTTEQLDTQKDSSKLGGKHQQLIRRILSGKTNTIDYLGEVGFNDKQKETKSDI